MEAEKYLRLCLKLDDGYFEVTARFWRAIALFHLGKFGAARTALNGVPDGHSDLWLLGRRNWSKSSLLDEINGAENHEA
jgi:hypothetical protein